MSDFTHISLHPQTLDSIENPWQPLTYSPARQFWGFAPSKASLTLFEWPLVTQGPAVSLSPSVGQQRAPEVVCKSEGNE